MNKIEVNVTYSNEPNNLELLYSLIIDILLSQEKEDNNE